MAKFFKIFSTLVILAALPIGVYLVGKAIGFWGKAGGIPANLIIDAGFSFPNSNYAWKNLAQGGEEKVNMFANVVSQITALHPNYIRIDHVYDYYDEAKLDEVINTIKSTGAKPFLSLTYDDSAIDWPSWELKVQKTIEHVSGNLGIKNVYYEIGNEPDFFGGWKTYGTKNYFDLYAHAIAGALRAKVNLPFKIGGPATTNLYPDWAQNFAKFVLANNLRLDFYSWHQYSMDLDKYEVNSFNAAAWLTESGLPANKELIISEVGPNSENNPIYDTNIGAIHAIATTAVLEDKISKLFTFEVKDGPINKWGILNHDAVPKPRYNALLFLNNMIGDRVHVTGQGSWVKAFSKSNGKSIKTLVVNFDPENNHTEAVPLNFVNLRSKNFEFKRIDFDDSPTGKVSKDISIATTEPAWSTLELMNPNTAAMMEIILP